MQYDFIAIGDTVSDAFIELEDASVHCQLDNEDCTISMRWGDKIPYRNLTLVHGVGNSANAAVAANRLGLNTALITDIGNDIFGDETIAYFEKENLDTTYVRRHDNIPTNYHFVLSFNAERTILVKHEQYPYTFPQHCTPPKTLYLSSIGENTEAYHDAIIEWCEAHPDMMVAFQPGTFQMKLGMARLRKLYARANLFFANKEEYQRILDLPPTHDDVPDLLERMHALGINIPILTDGRAGAYALQDGELIHVPMFPDPAPPVERTGAGDAFSSTTAAFFTAGMPLKEAMRRGTVNSAYVVQKIGAQAGLLTKEEIESHLS
jgi:sugar/nucleoside kinase (ribokinase family)